MKFNAENIPTSTITLADKIAHTGPLWPEHLDAWELGHLFSLLRRPVDKLEALNKQRQDEYFKTKYRADKTGKKLHRRDVKLVQLALKIRTGQDWRGEDE